MGRPSKYTDELATTICNRIAQGESLVDICKTPGIPHYITVIRWLSEEDKRTFASDYARARDLQADVMDARILQVANESTPESAPADRVKLIALQWRASRLAPKRYGDRVTNEHVGPDGGPLQVERIERTIVDPAVTAIDVTAKSED